MSDSKYNILYIDDELHNLRTFKATFKWDYKIFTASSAFDGFDILEQNPIHLIISDQRMAGLSGTEFFKRVIKRFPEPMRIILTGYSDMDVIIRAINECGIDRYITKPWNESDMRHSIEKILEVYQLRKDNQVLLQQLKEANTRLEAENAYLIEEIKQDHNFENIVTQSTSFKKILKLVERVANTNTTVLITGESGTGKELMSRAVHSLSKRNNKPLIKVNCAALPANLIESELFGHERGAFTGATQKRLGRFELADKGTIFLDEIGEMPLELQAKLLRVLQEGEFERLGGTKTLKVDVRVIVATNRNLEQAVEKGIFREDLFYRLNVFPIHSPPLRERKEDIPYLVAHFLKKHENNIGRSIAKVSDEALQMLMDYNFPGNIRELENLVERFMITSSGDILELDGWQPISTKKETQGISNTFLSLEEMEFEHITQALKQCNWKVFGEGGAAEKLKINPKTLSSRMKKLGISKPK